MERIVKQQVRGHRTQDGAGVNLVRVLGYGTVKEYDPIEKRDIFEKGNFLLKAIKNNLYY